MLVAATRLDAHVSIQRRRRLLVSSVQPVRVLIFTWRDARHPEAGGSETFVERVSDGLVSLGHEVTIFTAGYDGAVATETKAGRTYLRRGGRYSVYARAGAHLLRSRKRYDVVLDVQNGVPFWTPLWTSTPAVNVVHHVHKEQWPEVFGPARARFGWWLESRAAPKVYARSTYLTVSDATRQELVSLGIDPQRVSVVYSGNDLPVGDSAVGLPKAPHPQLVVLGRLVPHKRVELALEAVARYLPTYPDLRLAVVGHGYWESELRARAANLGVTGQVDFLGFVDDAAKQAALAQAWVQLLPSVKEGWGLVVLEAGFHRTPTVAFRAAGGTTESVVDRSTGLLADSDEDFVAHVGELLADATLREDLGRVAHDHARKFSWDGTARGVETVLLEAAGRSADGSPVPSATSSRT
jgi:glycosyltransferase involved in cell wall biosynthesis